MDDLRWIREMLSSSLRNLWDSLIVTLGFVYGSISDIVPRFPIPLNLINQICTSLVRILLSRSLEGGTRLFLIKSLPTLFHSKSRCMLIRVFSDGISHQDEKFLCWDSEAKSPRDPARFMRIVLPNPERNASPSLNRARVETKNWVWYRLAHYRKASLM